MVPVQHDISSGSVGAGGRYTPARESGILVSIVENDAALLDVIGRTLLAAGYEVARFDSAEALLGSDAVSKSACVLIDLRLSGDNGFDLQQRLCAEDPDLPLIFMSGYADARAVASALRSGAVEFLVKPFRQVALLEAVRVAVARSVGGKLRQVRGDRLRTLLARLTPRETEVLEMLITGSDTKAVGIALAISPRTVEIHRQHLMHKMKVTSVVALARLCLDLDSLTDGAPPTSADS